MEAKELTLADKVIGFEVALKNKNETIDKHLKLIRLLNEKHSEDRKACNFVTSIKDYCHGNRLCFQICRSMTSGSLSLRTKF